MIERYVAGRLDAAERDAFEQHFLECDACFETVELASSIREGFAAEDESSPTVANPRPAPAWSGSRRALLVAAAAVITIAAGVGVYRSLQSGPDPRLVALGELSEMPAYLGTAVRGETELGEAEARFREGMEAYTAGDYATAAGGIRASLEIEPGNPGRSLYLGACLLAIDRPEAAIEPLRVAATEPSLAAESGVYVARAYLRLGKGEEALAALENAQEGMGPFVSEARSLADRVRDITGR